MSDDIVRSRDNWFFGVNGEHNILKDKQRLIEHFISKMYIRTQSIFEYKNLPETIPKDELELYIQSRGYAIITKVNDKLYAFYGGLGGLQNEYYLPTIAIVNNPYLKFNKQLEIGKDCVIIRNDPFYQGLRDLNEYYASLLAENVISIRLALINSRILSIVSAQDSDTKDSLDQFFKDIEDGKEIRAIVREDLSNALQDLKVDNYGIKSIGGLKELIESNQYILASWLNELGLNANYNMKREALNSAETQVNEDSLRPSIDTYLKERQNGWDLVNKIYGTNVKVELSSSWKDLRDDYIDLGDGTNIKILNDDKAIQNEDKVIQNEDKVEVKEDDSQKEVS